MLHSPAGHASEPYTRPLDCFSVLGRGGVHPFWPGWQVLLGQTFPPGLPSTAGIKGVRCSLVLKYPPLCPPALPSCRPPAMRAACLPHPESSARLPVAVRRHPGWHPGLTPNASPPQAEKTLSSAPTRRLPPGLPPALQQETRMHGATPQAAHQP